MHFYPDANDLTRLRLTIASIFIKGGDGLEIAPWENPLFVAGCNIRHVEINPEHVTQPGQILDNGEVLATVPAGSLDFIIACHVLEHFENPIGAIRTHLGKLKPHGWLYYILPDKNFKTCDQFRDTTPFEHMLEDYRNNKPPARSDPGHLHVWNDETAYEFFVEVNKLLGHPYRLVHFSVNPPNLENIIMLEKVREAK